MTQRYSLQPRPDGVLVIDAQEHRSVLLAWDQVGDIGDGLQLLWNRHWASDLPLEPHMALASEVMERDTAIKNIWAWPWGMPSC